VVESEVAEEDKAALDAIAKSAIHSTFKKEEDAINWLHGSILAAYQLGSQNYDINRLLLGQRNATVKSDKTVH
jgi:hypothetical protein